MLNHFIVKIKNILLLLISFLFATCAHQLPPGGGEVDLIPPEIIEIFPEDGTINFKERYIEIGFSEYVDKRSVQDAIFISPAIDGALEYNWSGKYLRVRFPESLRENFTYVITIGTDVADLNNRNRMAQAFSFAFSTGSEIDKRVIIGKVYDEKAADAMIFAYLLNGDEKNLLDRKPDYISQSGKNGSFKLAGLAAGNYRVFAVKDQFRDLLFQPDQDNIGIPFTDVTLSRVDTLYEGLDFFLTKIDTVSPRLISAVMTDAYHILINLSENIDSTIIRADNFVIIDSTSGQTIKPLYAYKGNTKATEFVLVTNPLKEENNIFLLADTLRDIAGNVYLSDYTSIIVSIAPDTNKPKIFKTIPFDRTDKADFLYQEFFFFFDDAFNTSEARTGIALKDTFNRTFDYDLFFIDDGSFRLTPKQRLEPQKNYIIEIDLSKFKDASGNYYDSVYQYKFKTISGLEFTGVMGTIRNIDFNANPVIVLESIERDKRKYQQQLKGKNNFNIERVDAGKYVLWCYFDTDSSGTYSYGWHDPFKHSEVFSFYPDTLELRPRWTQTDIKFFFRPSEEIGNR